MQIIHQINRWLDGLIIILVIAVIAIGFVQAQEEKRKRQPRFDYKNVSSGLRMPLNGEPDTLANCQLFARLTAYYSACAGKEPSTSTAPLTCPEARPDTVSREPTLRSAVTVLSRLYATRYQRGQCDKVIADAETELNKTPDDNEKAETNDPN